MNPTVFPQPNRSPYLVALISIDKTTIVIRKCTMLRELANGLYHGRVRDTRLYPHSLLIHSIILITKVLRTHQRSGTKCRSQKTFCEYWFEDTIHIQYCIYAVNFLFTYNNYVNNRLLFLTMATRIPLVRIQ